MNKLSILARVVIEEAADGRTIRVVESHADGFLVLGQYDDREVAAAALARFAAEIRAEAICDRPDQSGSGISNLGSAAQIEDTKIGSVRSPRAARPAWAATSHGA